MGNFDDQYTSREGVSTGQSFLTRGWSEWTVDAKIAVAIAGAFGLYYAVDYAISPTVTRPIYNSREECLADWANTPQDCQEDISSSSGGRIRHWYGPWTDRDSGTVYHENGTRTVRSSSSIHGSGFSSSTRLGFGGSSSGRGG